MRAWKAGAKWTDVISEQGSPAWRQSGSHYSRGSHGRRRSAPRAAPPVSHRPLIRRRPEGHSLASAGVMCLTLFHQVSSDKNPRYHYESYWPPNREWSTDKKLERLDRFQHTNQPQNNTLKLAIGAPKPSVCCREIFSVCQNGYKDSTVIWQKKHLCSSREW